MEYLVEWRMAVTRGTPKSRGSVELWCRNPAALAPEKGGHHEVGGPPGPAPQPDKCASTLAIIRRVKGKAKGQ